MKAPVHPELCCFHLDTLPLMEMMDIKGTGRWFHSTPVLTDMADRMTDVWNLLCISKIKIIRLVCVFGICKFSVSQPLSNDWVMEHSSIV